MMFRNHLSFFLTLATYVAFISYNVIPVFFSLLSDKNVESSLPNAPFHALPSSSSNTSSSSVSTNSLIYQLRDKLLTDENDRRRRDSLNDTNNNSSDTNSASSFSTQKTILCCIALHEEAYIDEFVDYHLGIGFRKVIVYDNSDYYEMKQWGDKRNRRAKLRTRERNEGRTTYNSSIGYEVDSNNDEVHVLHYPGKGKQGASYLDCARRAYHGDFGDGIEYAAFWDIDEFLILKQHTTVDELLEEYMIDKGASSLSINWHMFRHGNRNVYEPLPVTKRFLYRDCEVQYQVKSMVRLEDMDMTKENHPHYPHLKNGTIRIDTNGTRPYKMFNHNGPNNIAILHHYQTKSYAEYIKKRERGRAEALEWNPMDRHPGYEKRVQDALDEYVEAMRKYNSTSYDCDDKDGCDEGRSSNGTVYDDTAWTAIKRVCPKYALYEILDEI